MADDNVDGDRRRVDEIYDESLAAKTRKSYLSSLRTLEAFLHGRHPEMLDADGTINLENFTLDAFERFVADKQAAGRGYSTLAVRFFSCFMKIRAPVLVPPSSPLPPLFFLFKIYIIKGYRSAIQFAYKDAGLEFPDDFDANLPDYYKGLKRIITQEKQDGTRKAKEGKEPLPFGLYRWLCEYFISNGDIFAWCYLTLAWNLISRSGNIAEAHLIHVTFGEDCLKFVLPRTKSDQSTFILILIT